MGSRTAAAATARSALWTTLIRRSPSPLVSCSDNAASGDVIPLPDQNVPDKSGMASFVGCLIRGGVSQGCRARCWARCRSFARTGVRVPWWQRPTSFVFSRFESRSSNADWSGKFGLFKGVHHGRGSGATWRFEWCRIGMPAGFRSGMSSMIRRTLLSFHRECAPWIVDSCVGFDLRMLGLGREVESKAQWEKLGRWPYDCAGLATALIESVKPAHRGRETDCKQDTGCASTT